MKKINKILTNVLLGALTLSSLGLANVQAQTTDTDASVTIDEGPIEPKFPTGEIKFPSETFSFAAYFGSEAYSKAAESGSLELGMNDQRSLNGITKGWKVTAQLSTFTNAVIDGETLPDTTYISLNGGAPSQTTVNDEIKAPKVNPGEIKLVANNSETLIWSANRADDGGKYLSPVGVDNWTLNYEASDIKLTILTKMVVGSHSAKITWTFSDTIADSNVE